MLVLIYVKVCPIVFNEGKDNAGFTFLLALNLYMN